MSSDIVALVADPVSMFMATVLSNSQGKHFSVNGYHSD